jgi:FkbM family methyltransferase
MIQRVKWLLTRPRAIWRAATTLGLWSTLQLVRIRLAPGKRATYSLRIPKFPHAITIRGGQSSDTWAVYELLVMQEYALVGDLDSPAFIIDGGANIGIASLYFLNQYPSAHLVAVEPSPANFEILRKNLAPYAERVTLIQGAIWKSRGRLILEQGDEDWRTSVRADDSNHSGTVEAFTLPSLIAYGNGTVDLLKLDIEGSESEVFGPEARQWLPAVRNIAIELHSKVCSDRFFGALDGYQFDRPEHHKDNVVVCRDLRAPVADQLMTAARHWHQAQSSVENRSHAPASSLDSEVSAD